MQIFLIPFMMFLGRGAGSDWWGMKQVFGFLFAFVLSICSFYIYDLWMFSVFSFLIAWGGYETGHGTFYRMIGRKPNLERKEKIEKIIIPIFNKFNLDIHKPLYSWFCMGFKGFLIGVPLGIFGIPLILLYPASYWYGMRIEEKGSVSELISSMCVGLCICAGLFY